MFVELYDVRVNDSTTRFFQVPAYDIPIIKLMNAGRESRPGVKVTVDAKPMGIYQPRSLWEERTRMAREYRTVADADPGKAAWKAIYPTEASLEEAYHKEVEVGTKGYETAEKARAKAEEDARKSAEEAGKGKKSGKKSGKKADGEGGDGDGDGEGDAGSGDESQ